MREIKYDLIASIIIALAQKHGWKGIEHIEKDFIIICRRKGTRMNIWYDRMSVGTALHHPRRGNSQMIRKKVSFKVLEGLFDDPRTHTGTGYRLKKGRNWNKTYRHKRNETPRRKHN